MRQPSVSPAPADPPHLVPVAEVMARLADGDDAAVFVLAEHHGSRIAAVIRRQLRRCGVDRIHPDDLDGLVLDACIELREVAGSWRPGGALPWWWAEGRIRSVVNRWVGVHADALDDQLTSVDADDSPVASSFEDSVAETFARLCDEVPAVRLVAEAARAARVDDIALVCILDYRIQQDQGDPSPAHTLAERYGVSPQTLRKRVSRGRARLREVVAADPRFAALADFTLVA